MADPVITDHFRVLATFERSSEMPEDQVVNSWAFRNDGIPGDLETLGNEIQRVLDAFYFGEVSAGQSIGAYMSPDLTALNYRVYDLGQAPPREPLIVPSLDFNIISAGSPLVEEAAVVMSMKSDGNGKRDRGRLYLGPLRTSAVQAVDGRTRVSTAFRNVIADRATDVIQTTENVTWTFVSQADAAAKVVTRGYIDNAFDTQRSRGIEADTRLLFPITV